MIERRHFLIGSAGIGAAAFASPLAMANAAAPLAARPSLIALFDGQIGDGRDFEAAARSQNFAVHDTKRDVASLLYGELRGWGENKHVMLAGVTRYADFQIAAGIAREQGRVIIGAFAPYADHEICANRAEMEHQVGGGGGQLPLCVSLLGKAGNVFLAARNGKRDPATIAWLCA